MLLTMFNCYIQSETEGSAPSKEAAKPSHPLPAKTEGPDTEPRRAPRAVSSRPNADLDAADGLDDGLAHVDPGGPQQRGVEVGQVHHRADHETRRLVVGDRLPLRPRSCK